MAKWIWIGLIVIVVAIAAWVFVPMPTNHTQPTGQALIGGPFSLENQDGKPVTNKDFRGEYMLIYFGYTYCPDICPVDLQTMSTALDLLDEGTLARIQPIFITIDPERDTPEVMGEYISHFHPRLIGLTGTEAEINQAARAYRVYRRKVPGKDPGEYQMDHSAITYLMGPKGRYITHFTSGATAREMAHKLELEVK